jgi:hypothetical protein
MAPFSISKVTLTHALPLKRLHLGFHDTARTLTGLRPKMPRIWSKWWIAMSVIKGSAISVRKPVKGGSF